MPQAGPGRPECRHLAGRRRRGTPRVPGSGGLVDAYATNLGLTSRVLAVAWTEASTVVTAVSQGAADRAEVDELLRACAATTRLFHECNGYLVEVLVWCAYQMKYLRVPARSQRGGGRAADPGHRRRQAVTRGHPRDLEHQYYAAIDRRADLTDILLIAQETWTTFAGYLDTMADGGAVAVGGDTVTLTGLPGYEGVRELWDTPAVAQVFDPVAPRLPPTMEDVADLARRHADALARIRADLQPVTDLLRPIARNHDAYTWSYIQPPGSLVEYTTPDGQTHATLRISDPSRVHVSVDDDGQTVVTIDAESWRDEMLAQGRMHQSELDYLHEHRNPTYEPRTRYAFDPSTNLTILGSDFADEVVVDEGVPPGLTLYTGGGDDAVVSDAEGTTVFEMGGKGHVTLRAGGYADGGQGVDLFDGSDNAVTYHAYTVDQLDRPPPPVLNTPLLPDPGPPADGPGPDRPIPYAPEPNDEREPDILLIPPTPGVPRPQ